jgi:hypothetical protein
MPLLLFALVITALVIYLAWRGTGARGDDSGATPVNRPKPRPRVVAPDDDPEFLGEINRRLHGGDNTPKE